MRHWATTLGCVAMGGSALAAAPTTVQLPAATPHAPAEFRLKAIVAPANPIFQIDDPRSKLATGYGGALIDLFPIAGGKLHFSAGPRLFGRAGRPHLLDSEPLRYLPAFRMPGLRASRRMAPAMLVGYGRPVESGLSLGVDAGVIIGKITPTPDRVGHLNASRVATDLDRGRPEQPMNGLMRVTALYRF